MPRFFFQIVSTVSDFNRLYVGTKNTVRYAALIILMIIVMAAGIVHFKTKKGEKVEKSHKWSTNPDYFNRDDTPYYGEPEEQISEDQLELGKELYCKLVPIVTFF